MKNKPQIRQENTQGNLGKTEVAKITGDVFIYNEPMTLAAFAAKLNKPAAEIVKFFIHIIELYFQKGISQEIWFVISEVVTRNVTLWRKIAALNYVHDAQDTYSNYSVYMYIKGPLLIFN